MAAINRGSFTTTHQDGLKKVMLEEPRGFIRGSPSVKWDLARYNNALKFLGDASPSTVEIWLARPNPDGRVSSEKKGTGTFATPKGIVVIDCRATPLGFHEKAFRIKESFTCAARKDENNAIVFGITWDLFKKFHVLENPPARIVFYDNVGQFRGPEIALRYIDAVSQFGDKTLLNRQDVCFLDGGITRYKNEIQNSPFLEPEPNVDKAPIKTGS